MGGDLAQNAFQLFTGAVQPWTTLGPTLGWTFTASGVPGHPDVRGFFGDATLLRKLYYVTDGSEFDGSELNIVGWDWPAPGTLPANAVGIGHNGLLNWQAYTVAAARSAPPNPPRLFLGSEDNAAICSDNWGNRGRTFYSNADVASIVVHPIAHNVAYMLTTQQQNGYFKATTNADAPSGCQSAVWSCPSGSPLCTRSPFNLHTNMLAVDPLANHEQVLAVGAPGVWLSTDGGVTAASVPGKFSSPVTSVYIDGDGFAYAGRSPRRDRRGIRRGLALRHGVAREHGADTNRPGGATLPG